MATPQQLEALTQETSLLDVYVLSRKIRGRAIYRFYVVEWVFAALIMLGAVSSNATTEALATNARDWSNVGFGFAVAILGFLLAGYTIFATLSGAEFVQRLVESIEPKSQLNYLKYSTIQFMSVFIHYLIFVGVHLVVILLGWRGGPLGSLVRLMSCLTGMNLWRGAAIFSMCAIGGFLVHLGMILQAFVFNVYSSVMAMARLRLSPPPKP